MNQARSFPRKYSPTKSHLHDKTGKKLISREFLASDRPWLLWVRVCRFVFAFVFNFRPARTLYRMNSKALLFEGFFELAKEQGLLRFSSTTWNRYNVLSFYISLQKQNSRSRTATTNFKTETQTCGNRTTPRLLRDLLIKRLLTTCWQQSIKDN